MQEHKVIDYAGYIDERVIEIDNYGDQKETENDEETKKDKKVDLKSLISK